MLIINIGAESCSNNNESFRQAVSNNCLPDIGNNEIRLSFENKCL